MNTDPVIPDIQAIKYLDRTFQAIMLKSGRKLAISTFGATDGKPVFYFHGSPSSRLEGALLHKTALERGYRIIAIDRPGHGYSDLIPGYRVIDMAGYTKEIADELGLEHFGVLGTSGGGPAVIACACTLADRLDFALSCGGAAPVYTDPVASQELSALDRFSARLGDKLPRWAFILIFGPLMGMVKRVRSARQYKRIMGEMLCEADLEIIDLYPNFVPALTYSLKEAFRQGAAGPSDDAIAIYKDWGFSLNEVEFPIIIAHGTADKHVPFSFAEYMHSQLPHSMLVPLEGEGHYTHLVNSGRTFDLIEGKVN